MASTPPGRPPCGDRLRRAGDLVRAVGLVLALARLVGCSAGCSSRPCVAFCRRWSTTVGASGLGAGGCGVVRRAGRCLVDGVSTGGGRRGARRGRGRFVCGSSRCASLRRASWYAVRCRRRAPRSASGTPRPAAVRPPPASARQQRTQSPASGAGGRHHARILFICGSSHWSWSAQLIHVAGYAHRDSYRQAGPRIRKGFVIALANILPGLSAPPKYAGLTRYV